jgi:hypothetical protein
MARSRHRQGEGRANMKQLLETSVLIALAFVVPHAATAQDAPRTQVVPVEKAPFHVPMFGNEFVTMLNANIPAGRTASYHKHSLDMISVVVESAKTRTQVLGETPIEAQTPSPAGAVNYNSYSKNPKIHQVTNIDSKPFHVVGFEFIYEGPRRFSPSFRVEVPAYQTVVDNERVRGWRLVLEPDQSVSAFTQKAPGVRVVLKGGELVESEPGQPERAMSLKLGDFMWQEANVTRAVRNAGATQIELVEFELK